MVCLDELGPEAAKRFLGRQPVRACPAPDPTPPAARPTQEMDDGRRGKGDICGAVVPATGDALTAPSAGRTIANWVDFLQQVDTWLPAPPARGYAVRDTLSTHRARDVVVFALAHPRWEFGCPPTCAA